MKKCVHCDRKISDKTPTCYYCGRDQDKEYETPIPRRTLNSYALASVILSVTSVVAGSFILPQIIAFYLGFKGLATFDEEEDKGLWMCWTGIIISAVIFLAYAGIWIYFITILISGEFPDWMIEYMESSFEDYNFAQQ